MGLSSGSGAVPQLPALARTHPSPSWTPAACQLSPVRRARTTYLPGYPSTDRVSSHVNWLSSERKLWLRAGRHVFFPGMAIRFSLSPRLKRIGRWTALVLLAAYAILFLFHLTKPMPEGTSVSGPARTAAGMEFLHDLTYQRAGQRNGPPTVDQEIFDRVLAMIEAADEYVVLDMFLFNGEHGGERAYRPLSPQLTASLIEARRANPGLRATFITDEINNFYGAYTSPEISALKEAGVEVVTTRLERLRDSNPAYSAAWRIALGWLPDGGLGWLPHPLSSSGRKVTARAYFKLLNFKANHRKLIITEDGCLISSANPHDASAFHSNIAFAGKGPICGDLLKAEKAVAAFSGGDTADWPIFEDHGPAEWATGGTQDHDPTAPGTVRLVTEGKILQTLLEDLASAGSGDRVDLAMFYLSERQVVDALLGADARGAEVRLILDPNKDAFGRQKGGVPNRPVARELVRRSEGRIAIRWYDTHGEQFHTKLFTVTRGDVMTVMGGSANLTRRNIDDYNLEADLRFEIPADSPMAMQVSRYFERIFGNEDGNFTLSVEAYWDGGLLKRILYRTQELTGFASF